MCDTAFCAHRSSRSLNIDLLCDQPVHGWEIHAKRISMDDG